MSRSMSTSQETAQDRMIAVIRTQPDDATWDDLVHQLYGPFQKYCNVGQVANLPETRQIGNLPHMRASHPYWNGPYVARKIQAGIAADESGRAVPREEVAKSIPAE